MKEEKYRKIRESINEKRISPDAQKWFKRTAIVLGLIITGILMHFYDVEETANRQQREIAGEIIRFHVIANSDSERDQALKLKVRDTVVTYLRGAMTSADSVEKAREIIASHLGQIEEIAMEKIKEEGYEYRAYASLGESYFPVKEYGEFTFPAGNYQALRLQIGESRGHNWWCVMYPSLCFVDSVYQVVPDDSKEKLKECLTEEDYNLLLDGGENIKYSVKIVEWIRKLL